jgi:hypothetical protein
MNDLISGSRNLVPDDVLKASRAAVVERHGESAIHDVIFTHAGLLGDYLLFLRHGGLYLAVSVALLPDKEATVGPVTVGFTVKRPRWKADILTAYYPPAADWGDEVD